VSLRSRAGEPGAELATEGMSLLTTDVKPIMAASWNAEVRPGPISLSPARCLDPRAGSEIAAFDRSWRTWAAPPPSLSLTGELPRLSQAFE
jgi:hypothetical protein